jgi:hypothetical protein
MLIEQISVFVENKKGALKDLLGILAGANIDLRAMSIADTSDFGILRMIVADPDAALALLKKNGISAKKTEVTGCRLPDEPGALHKLLSVLCDAGISVEYIYAFLARSEKDAFVVLKVEDNGFACGKLEKAGFSILNPSDLAKL